MHSWLIFWIAGRPYRRSTYDQICNSKQYVRKWSRWSARETVGNSWRFFFRFFFGKKFFASIRYSLKFVGRQNCKATLCGCNQAINSVDFDAESNLVIAASNDNAIRIWTVTDERLRVGCLNPGLNPWPLVVQGFIQSPLRRPRSCCRARTIGCSVWWVME